MNTADHDRTPRMQRGCAFGCLASALLIGGLVWAAVLSFPFSSGKYEPADPSGDALVALPGPVQAEHQTEPHTCGLHSMRSVYRAYGLDPVARELRFRLGVDRPGLPFDHATLGTIHPDLFRVAAQDGFAITVGGEPAEAVPTLRAHLADGHLALLLIRTRTSGALHWVIGETIVDEGIFIHDSLADAPYREPLPTWLDSHVVSVLLVRPAPDGASSSANEAHAAGLAEMQRVAARLGD